jgi:hypothetical protein
MPLFTYIFKKGKNKETKILFCTYINYFRYLFLSEVKVLVTFLNLTAGIFFGSLMLMTGKNSPQGFLRTLLSPFIFVLTSVFTRSKYYPVLDKFTKPSKTRLRKTLIGIFLSVLMLAVTLPLLATANPIFEKMVNDMWHLLNLENLFSLIGYENLFLWSLRFMFFLVFLFILPKMLTLMNNNFRFELPNIFQFRSLSLDIPKFVLGLVLLVFFFTELQFYFADSQTLQSLGVSNSEHTREVFGQLTVVVGLLFLLIFNDKTTSLFSKLLTWVLGFQGIFLSLIAFRSVFEYINLWGFTYKRLYGVSFATLIFSILLLFLFSYINNTVDGSFVKRSLIIYAVILFLVNIINFDYLIYHFRKASTGQGIDHAYLIELSADSMSYKDQLEELERLFVSSDGGDLFARSNAPFRFALKLNQLKEKYNKIDIRTLNVLDYLQYLEIKDIDTEYYVKRFDTFKYSN